MDNPYAPGTEAWLRAAAAELDSMVAADERSIEEQQFDIRVWDRNYDLRGFCNDYITATVEFARNRVGPGQIVVPGDSEWGPVMMRCWREVVPITVDVNGKRWSGRVDTCERTWDANGLTYTATLVSDYAWLQSIYCWPSPYAPLGAQLPKSMNKIGPAITCMKEYLRANLDRLQIPLWPILNDLSIGGLVSHVGGVMNPNYWRNLDGDQDNSPVRWDNPLSKKANWPVAVVPTDVRKDGSKWVAMTARMVDADTLFTDILKDEGLTLTAELHIPGEDAPIPGLELTRPTIVIDIVDKSVGTGEVGNPVTGLARTVVEFAADKVTKVIKPYNGPDSEKYKQREFFGQDPTQSWVTLWESERSGISMSRITAHHPLARYALVGGRSPGWLNKGVNLLIEGALSAVLTFAGMAGIAPTLLDGVLDDVFLAFDRYYDMQRNADLGPYGFYEYFAPGGAAALSLSGLTTGLSALHDTRGYLSYVFDIDDRAPYQFGKHMEIGDPINVEAGGLLYRQYLDSAVVNHEPGAGIATRLGIGDPSAEESPTARMDRKLKRLGAFIQASYLNN